VRAINIFSELQRRNVYRVAVAYAVVSWLLVQIATQVFPFFDIPNWATRLVVIVLLLGFPVALVFAWAFELTPEGIKRTEEVEPHQSIRRSTGRKLDFVIIGILLLVIGVFAFHTYRSRRAEPRFDGNSKSIAVLPFDNLSADRENAFFTDGLQDEILLNLSKVADLKVISRTSVMQYKAGVQRSMQEIAKQLGVSYILEGSVERAADRLRLRAQLIDARTDNHIWAEQYDRGVADVFAIQTDIAKRIVDQLQAKISPSEKAAIEKAPTSDLLAYDKYLRAEELFADTSDPVHAREKLPKAAQLLDEAVRRDPKFVQAWCLLSRVHGATYFRGHDHTPERLRLAEAAVQTAMRLQADAGEAHLALAIYWYNGFRDYEKAHSELAIARRTLPNNADVFTYNGFVDRREGRWEDATRSLERALELDPRNFFTIQQLAHHTYLPQRRYADAVQAYDRALTIAPDDPNTRILRALVAVDGRADIAAYQTELNNLLARNASLGPDIDTPLYSLCERTQAAAERMLRNYPAEGEVSNGVKYPHAYWAGAVAKWRGDEEGARRAFTEARNEVAPLVEKQPDFASALSLLGMIDAGLGRTEEALREGERSCKLLPVSKDAVDGMALAINLAQIYAWSGRKDLAIQQIAAVERMPNTLSYGLLKLHPFWDSLRGDAQFEAIVASLAPR
jgi:TolB-like protein/Tfp pilus assembly protein PilF